MLERARPQSPFYTAEHEAFRDVVRRFVEQARSSPTPSEWDEAGEFPRALYEKAAEIGLLGLGFPEEYGGIAADHFMRIVAVAGTGARRRRRRQRQPEEQYHRRAADRARRAARK